ncbi:hypothetical protein [Sutcliffiella rhizosphaerae]|uniref:ABC transporter permease n=1 Tax=Sutcliffiella rhizosphaerae TaxID=2880967 RepID=A0ABN8A9E8_9BACI|nr:hypothetical protein [Sutcliffiella rhizosphaerae]CAG9620597.1 hypothetical protein BACCIP111883_01366 [Sutcliffiella rhizosphaerae]
MYYYTGLLVKDWKISMKGQWQTFLLLLLLWLLGLGASIHWKSPDIVLGISLTLIGIHIFYISVDMLLNFGAEMKLKIWLHNPASSSAMLTSKLTISLLNCLLSIFYCVCFYAFSCILFGESFLQGKSLYDALALIWTIIGIAVYLGIWTLFFWSLFTALKSNRLAYWRYVICGIFAYILLRLHLHFFSSEWFSILQSLGTFQAFGISTSVIQQDMYYQEVAMGVQISNFSIALFILFSVLSIVVFFFTAKNITKIEI